MKLDYIWGRAVLVVKEIKETYARLPDWKVAVWKEEVTEDCASKLRSCARDLTGKRTARIDAGRRGNLRDHRVPLVIHKNQLVVPNLRLPGLKFVVRQRGVDHKHSVFAGRKTGVRGLWAWRWQSNQLGDVRWLRTCEVDQSNSRVCPQFSPPSLPCRNADRRCLLRKRW